MATIGPWRPEEETLQEYLHRIAHTAPRPNPEQYAELAALLRLEDTRG